MRTQIALHTNVSIVLHLAEHNTNTNMPSSTWYVQLFRFISFHFHISVLFFSLIHIQFFFLHFAIFLLLLSSTLFGAIVFADENKPLHSMCMLKPLSVRSMLTRAPFSPIRFYFFHNSILFFVLFLSYDGFGHSILCVVRKSESK